MSDDGQNFKGFSNTQLTDDNLQTLCKEAIAPPPRVCSKVIELPIRFDKHAGKKCLVIQIGPHTRQVFHLNRDFISAHNVAPQYRFHFRKHEVWIRRGATSDLASPQEVVAISTREKPLADSAKTPSVNRPKRRGIFSGTRTGAYQIALGKRHRHLREKILGINPRRMADFYRFEKVVQLEACERGDDEFPATAIKKLRQFFFISSDYLEGECEQIFDKFEIGGSSDDCKKLIAEGFRPFLLCLNEEREQMWCHPVFQKEEGGFDRVICADTGGYFASTGGGKANIMDWIAAIDSHNLKPHDVFVQKVDRKTWQRIEGGTFYEKHMCRFLGPDYEARDVFSKWFQEYKKEQAEVLRRRKR